MNLQEGNIVHKTNINLNSLMLCAIAEVYPLQFIKMCV